MDYHITCPCPDAPHPDGDTVTLKESLSFREASAVITLGKEAYRGEDDQALSLAMGDAALREGYLLIGIEAWTLVDAKGKHLPVSSSNVRDQIISRPDIAIVLAEYANDLYAKQVVLPLTVLAQMSSPSTPTSESTSATNGSTPVPRKRSKRSSISTTPMDDTETMSSLPGGDFSYSQR